MTLRALLRPVALVCSLAIPTLAWPSWGEKPTVRDLYCRATVVVHGVVTGQLEEQGSLLSTIELYRLLKGPPGASPKSVVERSSAGLHGGHTRYRPAQEVVAFLEALPDSPHYRTVQASQGKFEVVEGRVPRPGQALGDFLSALERLQCDEPPAPSG